MNSFLVDRICYCFVKSQMTDSRVQLKSLFKRLNWVLYSDMSPEMQVSVMLLYITKSATIRSRLRKGLHSNGAEPYFVRSDSDTLSKREQFRLIID